MGLSSDEKVLGPDEPHLYTEDGNVVNPAYNVFFCEFQCGCFKKVYHDGKVEYGSISKECDPLGNCPNHP